MGDGGDRSRELPQRVRGTTRGGPDQLTASGSPVLSEELRQRLQAAVKAERGETAAKEQPDGTKATEQSQRATVPGPADSQVKSPDVNGYHGQRKRAAKPEHPAKPNHAAKSKRTARPERPAEVGRSAEFQPVAQSKPVVKPLPARDVPADYKPTAQVQVQTPDQVQTDQVQTDQGVHPEAEIPNGPRRQRFGTARLVAFAVVFINIGVLGVLVSRYMANSSSDNGATNAALHRQELQVREQAASWVAQQVDHDDVVSCDRVMCAALEADGFPSRNLIVLSSNASSYPLNAAVVVDTATVRSLFGSSLANAYAPGTLASFGSGIAEISVRVIAPHGTGAYQAAVNSDLGQREISGRGLVNYTGRITFSDSARNRMVAGQVDSRLMLAITRLAAHQPIDILGFGNIAPGGDAQMPLRYADLAENDQAANVSESAYLNSLTTYMAAHYHQARTQIVTEDGQSVVRIEFTAPSPFGVFGGA
jgi:hypothetical protein